MYDSKIDQKLKKINLGSGTHIVEGWINIDNSLNIYLSRIPILKTSLYNIGLISESVFKADWKGDYIRHDVRKKLPFKSESIDVIYCSHLLEHLMYKNGQKVCREVFRILKHNGLFRVVVPDLRLLAKKYIECDRIFFGIPNEKPIADSFIEKLNFKASNEITILERLFSSLHKYMYDEESLKYLLKTSGFEDIRKCSYRKGLCPDLKKIEIRKRSVYIETIKI